MATGRIGVTPTLRTRWSKAPAGGTTSLSGLDDNSVSLVYDVGYEAVYRNGVLLSRTNDYTATTGNSITLIDATIAGDIIEVFANQLLPLTNAIGNGQYTAKGALLSATAASTPAVLTVGSNDQVLTADSSTSTGLKWATPTSGSLTQLASGSLSGTSVSITSISQSYKDLRLVITNAVRSGAGGTNISIQTNTNTSSNYIYSSTRNVPGGTMALLGNKGTLILAGPEFSGSASYHTTIVEFIDYTNSTTIVPIRYQGFSTANSVNTSFGVGCWYDTPAAVTSIQIGAQGDTFASGNYVLFGVK